MDELEETRDDNESPTYNLQESFEYSAIPEEISEEIHPELSSEELSQDIILISATKDPWSCGICKELFTDPVESICCHDLFCERCVINLSKCPRCRNQVSWVGNQPIRRILEDMMVRCRHQLCGKLLKKSDLVTHESNCELALIQCKFSNSCKAICRKDLNTHYIKECEYRPVDCSSGCGKVLSMCDIDSHQKYDCLNAEVSCPQSCGKSMQRRKIDYHILHNCPLSMISCMFFSYDGDYCGYKCVRAELEEHQLTCNLRKVRCNNIGCSQRVIYKSINEHDEICKYKKVSCQNGCGEEFLRGAGFEHSKTCDLEIVTCSYSEVGCIDTMLRKNIDEHLVQQSFEHSVLMVKWMKESAFKIEKIKFDIQRAKQQFYNEVGGIKKLVEERKSNLEVENIDLFLC